MKNDGGGLYCRRYLFMKGKTTMKCVLCKQEIRKDPLTQWDQGNNAEPLAEGRCCDNCNHDVLAAQILNAAYRSGYKLTGKIREAE